MKLKEQGCDGNETAKDPVSSNSKRMNSTTEEPVLGYGKWTTVQRNHRRPASTAKVNLVNLVVVPDRDKAGMDRAESH